MDNIEKIFDTEILKAFIGYDYCCSVFEANTGSLSKNNDYVLTHKSQNTSAEYRYSLMTNYIGVDSWWFSYAYIPSAKWVSIRITGPLYTDFNHEKIIFLEDNYEDKIRDLFSYLKNFIL